MICPQCQSKDFSPTPEVKYPIKNLGGKQNYDTFNIRNFACMVTGCGYKWQTIETFHREIGSDVVIDDTQQQLNLNGRQS